MNVMQTLSDFKQNLQAHPPSKPGAAQTAAGSTLKSAAAQSAPAAATSSSGAGSTTITANDFLQLLVAEMKNQDPTATQDPNAYIYQLLHVNSLQQLISINQDLTPAASGAAPAPGIARASTLDALGSADGTPSATVARSLTPPAAQPAKPLASAATDPAGAAANGLPGIGAQAQTSAADPVPSPAAGISIKRSAAAWRR